MTSKQENQLLLDAAVAELTAFLQLVNPRDENFVRFEIFLAVVNKFRHSQADLLGIQVLVLADWEFEIQVNGNANATLLIEKKGGIYGT